MEKTIGLLSELSFNSEDCLKSIADTTEENVKKEKRPFELGIHFGVRRCWEKFPCETIFG